MQDFLFYLQLGWEHIISKDALDHQFFILALITGFGFQDWKKILILVTAFTAGHSITLVVSILDIFRIPTNWVEFLIPITIAITVLDNILMKNNPNALVKTNYWFALFFGLIHGLGFANTARMMISEQQKIAVPLLGFNIGLELGQMLIVFIFLFINFLVIKYLKISRKNWTLLISAIILLFSLKIIMERIPI